MHRCYEPVVSVLLLAVLAVSSAACDSNSAQNKFAERAFSEEPEGYTRTLPSGAVDSSRIDEDDWNIGPNYEFGMTVDPAFPNPTSGSAISLLVQTGIDGQQGTNLTLCTNDPGGGLLALRSRRASSGALLTFNLSPSQVPPSGPGLKRLYVLDNNGASCSGRLVTYGDVLFE